MRIIHSDVVTQEDRRYLPICWYVKYNHIPHDLESTYKFEFASYHSILQAERREIRVWIETYFIFHLYSYRQRERRQVVIIQLSSVIEFNLISFNSKRWDYAFLSDFSTVTNIFGSFFRLLTSTLSLAWHKYDNEFSFQHLLLVCCLVFMANWLITKYTVDGKLCVVIY